MKNRFFLIFLFAVCACAVLSSCSVKELEVKPTGNDTSAPTDTALSSELSESVPVETVFPSNALQSPFAEINAGCTVDFVKEEMNIYDEDGKLLLLTGQFVYPVISVPSSTETENAINSYFEKEKERYYSESEKMHADSLELLENYETDYWNTFIYDKKFSLELVNSEMVSFLCHTEIYLGGAHPTPDEHGVVFSLSDGHVLKLNELFSDTEAMKNTVVPMIKTQIENSEAEPFDDRKDNIAPLVDEGNYFLANDGITFICNVYVLFPYAYGISYYTIPYEALEQYISFSERGSVPFSKFYSFDIDGEDGSGVLGYVDTREFSCPYDETDTCIVNGDERHGYYIVPKYAHSEIIIEHVLYDEDENEIGTEVFKTFKDTCDDFCLKLICPVTETKTLYRATVKNGDRSANFDLKYAVSTDKPVKTIG